MATDVLCTDIGQAQHGKEGYIEQQAFIAQLDCLTEGPADINIALQNHDTCLTLLPVAPSSSKVSIEMVKVASFTYGSAKQTQAQSRHGRDNKYFVRIATSAQCKIAYPMLSAGMLILKT